MSCVASYFDQPSLRDFDICFAISKDMKEIQIILAVIKDASFLRQALEYPQLLSYYHFILI